MHIYGMQVLFTIHTRYEHWARDLNSCWLRTLATDSR